MKKTKLKETIRGYSVEFTIGNQSFKTGNFGYKEEAIEYEKDLNAAFKSLYKPIDEEIPSIDQILLDKKLCDALRDIVLNSGCSFDEGYSLIKSSKNITRDSDIIKRLRNAGIAVDYIRTIILAMNADD